MNTSDWLLLWNDVAVTIDSALLVALVMRTWRKA